MVTSVKGPLYLGIAASIWGGRYLAGKYALGTIPPFTLLFIRYFLAAIILLTLCKWKQIPVIPREDKWLWFQIGFFGYFRSIAAQFLGAKMSSAYMGAVITSLSPVFQSIFAIAMSICFTGGFYRVALLEFPDKIALSRIWFLR